MMDIFNTTGNRKTDQYWGPHEFLGSKRVLFLYSVLGTFPFRNDVFAPWSVMDIMLALDMQSNDPIILIVDSPGGSIYDAFSMVDTMKSLESPVFTVSRSCMSAAVIVMSAGEKRYVFPHSRFMLHLPSSVFAGDVDETGKRQQEMVKTKNTIIDILHANGLNLTKKQVLNYINKEFWMGAEDMIKYGLADEILTGGWKDLIGAAK